jgi:hypothetical protein
LLGGGPHYGWIGIIYGGSGDASNYFILGKIVYLTNVLYRFYFENGTSNMTELTITYIDETEIHIKACMRLITPQTDVVLAECEGVFMN